jgi:cytochrome b561
MTGWQNSATRFGWVSRALHWVMAALILGQLGLGTGIVRMQPALSNLWLYGLHKSLGMTVLALAVLRLIWHRITPPPPPLGPPDHWTNHLAQVSHALIYVLMLAVPITGWLGASASGIDSVIFDRWTLPAIAPVSEAWQDAGFALHGICTKALMALLFLHIVGAIRRGLAHDGTLSRMITGR